MQKIYKETQSLDKNCYIRYGLSEDILMENASRGMYEYIKAMFDTTKSILIVAGSGNNGGDGIALARMLHNEYDVKLLLPFGVSSDMAKLQLHRATLIGVHTIEDVCKCDVVVDALFGSGLNKELDEVTKMLINRLNTMDAYKIACDVPSGVFSDGSVSGVAFMADVTISMGALKQSLFLDKAKDYVQDIIVANLGVSREVYESEHTNSFWLEKSDMNLPYRHKLDTHKGSFGHLATILGTKSGAGIISAMAGFNFGVGLSSVITYDRLQELPYEIMQSDTIPYNTTAITIGMGLGECESGILKSWLSYDLPYVIDADMFYRKEIIPMLNKQVVLTPHPKEFVSLLSMISLANIDIHTLQSKRFDYVHTFCTRYPSVVLVLKGANTIIANKDKIYINTFGTSALSFGGSGDILAGMIGALLAQGYALLDASITASLAHTLALTDTHLNNYAITPTDLLQAIKVIK